MIRKQGSWTPLLGTIILANILWFVTFALDFSIFWIKITLSALTLALISLSLKPDRAEQLRIDGKAVFIGLVSAAVLYLIFFLGKEISTEIFPFAAHQIGSVYGKGHGTTMWIIFILLFFITGPAEEIYWRGYVQDSLMHSLGETKAWLITTAIYAGVHLWSFNFMLIAAAGVAGAFWGLMYWRLRTLTPVIISHSVWSAVIFAVFPL